MLPLFLIVVVDLIGFGIIIPLLPFYGEAYDTTPAQVGLLMATYSLFQLIGAPLWGRLSDRVGRRPVLLISLAGQVVAYVGLAYAESLLALFAARAVGGLMAGNIATAFAYAADVTTPANRSRAMGLIGAAFGFGFVAGPAIGGLLAGSDPLAADYSTPALAAAGLSAIALILTAMMLKESLSPDVRRQRAALARSGDRAFREILTRPVVLRLLVMSFLATFAFAGVETMFALWSWRTFGWGPEQNGYLFAFVGVLSAVIQGGIIGQLANRLGEARLIVYGAVALAVGMALIPAAMSVPTLVAIMALTAIGFALASPTLNSLTSLQADPASQGGLMGVTRAVTTLGRVLGPGWAGLLFHYGAKDWPFFGGTIVMGMVVVLGLALIRRPIEPAASRQPPPSG